LDTNFRGFSLAKYTTQFKLEVVQQYLAGAIGYKSLGKQHGINDTHVKRWVSLYRNHGVSGLEKKHTMYSPQQKLAILQHMWDNELSYEEAAAKFNIRSPGSIPGWERCYHSGGLDALAPRPRGRPPKMSTPLPPKAQTPTDDESRTREELLAEVNYLRMENAYLKKLEALVQAQKQQRTSARKKRKS
jgi:transposase